MADHAMTDARQARYAEAVRLWAEDDAQVPFVARAVMAVADEELAESRAEVERLRSQRDGWMATLEQMEADRDHAQAREVALRARILDWRRGWFPRVSITGMWDALDAALASPAVDATPEPTPADGCAVCRGRAVRCATCRLAPAAEPQAEGDVRLDYLAALRRSNPSDRLASIIDEQAAAIRAESAPVADPSGDPT